MIDSLNNNLNLEICAVGRNINRMRERFANYLNSPHFNFILHDVNNALDSSKRFDFIIHLASNTHPVAYALNPIETILTNITGLNNLLKFAADLKTERFMFASSTEVYGENRGDITVIDFVPMEFRLDELIPGQRKYLAVQVVDRSGDKDHRADHPPVIGHFLFVHDRRLYGITNILNLIIIHY